MKQLDLHRRLIERGEKKALAAHKKCQKGAIAIINSWTGWAREKNDTWSLIIDEIKRLKP